MERCRNTGICRYGLRNLKKFPLVILIYNINMRQRHFKERKREGKMTKEVDGWRK